MRLNPSRNPRDRSEVVVPLIVAAGECWRVLDVNSFDVGAFSVRDAIAFNDALIATGLQTRRFHLDDVTVA
jgi:putative methionine-R-sulfoxide reductase with GAF domain